jgi:hypothetical protein
MDSQPSTGYGHPRGGDAFKLEKMKYSSEQPVPGEQTMRKTSVIKEEGEGEGELTKTIDEQRTKYGDQKVVKDQDGKDRDTKVFSRDEHVGVDVDVRKVLDVTEAFDADLERGSRERVAEKKISSARKKSRNEKRNTRKSGGVLASGNGQREGDAPSTEGESTGLRKRRNVNAGPYLNYPHLNEKSPGGRSGRGMF